MSLRSQSGKRTVIIQTKWSTKSNCGLVLSGKCFALCTNEMINAHSKTNRIQNDAGQYETFSFWFFDFEQCHLLDKCGIWPCYFVPTLENLPLITNVKNLTTFGWNPVKISCARYWWSVYLVILRNTAFNFSFGLWKPKLALWTGRGVWGRGRRVCQKVLHECFIEYPNAHQS